MCESDLANFEGAATTGAFCLINPKGNSADFQKDLNFWSKVARHVFAWSDLHLSMKPHVYLSGKAQKNDLPPGRFSRVSQEIG